MVSGHWPRVALGAGWGRQLSSPCRASSGGDLHYHLSQHGVFSEADMRFYAAEIILGLEHMHNRFVVYRDLKVRCHLPPIPCPSLPHPACRPGTRLADLLPLSPFL